MTLETILRTVLHAAAWSAFVAFCGVVATVGVCSMLRLLCHALAETGRRCGRWAAMTLASLALVCGVVAQKANTNDAPDGVSAPAPMMSGAMGTIAPPVDWAQSPSGAQSSLVGSLLLGAQSSRLRERPATAQDVEEWKLRGAYDDAIRIPAVGWDFRTPDGFVEGMTVFSRGEFRPDVGHLYFPRPFTNDLAFLPQSRWGLLPSGGESKLWFAATPSNSLLVTWVNGLIDRNPLTPTNFQAEFFPDGSYEYRYGDHSEPHPFMLPFDRDGDGLENTVDPEPETAGPDAHNTNAEWYNVVCSNIFTAVEGLNGVELSFRDGVDSNAYYFVDVSVSRAPAPVYFVADGPSRLGDPVIVATLGATNHVPLLVGATYSVTSDTPFTVTVPDASNIAITSTGTTSYQVRWPIIFEDAVTEVDGHSVHAFTPSSDLGGTFNWSVTSGGTSSDPGPSLMSGAPSVGCGFTSTGNQAWFACSQENCGCGGCTADGTYDYEGYRCVAASISCGCSHEEHHDPPPPDPLVAGFSVWTDRQAVIFEERYQNAPGQWVERRSTDVRIVLSASGGEHGGRLTLTTRNLDRLVPVASGPFLIPSTVDLAAHESWSLSFTCEGVAASAEENDVEIEGVFTENGTGRTIDDHVKLTVVRVELEAVNTPPANPCANRHTFGVFEKVELKHRPSSASVFWEMSGGGTTSTSEEGYVGENWDGTGWMLRCPLYAKGVGLKAKCGIVEWPFDVTVLEPSGLRAVRPTSFTSFQAGMSAVEMKVPLYLQPETVDFREISIQEIPVEDEPPMNGGCYTNLPIYYQTHTISAGAGRWITLREGNYCGEDKVRSIPVPAYDPRPGWQYMRLPWGWNKKLEYMVNEGVQFQDYDGHKVGGLCHKEVSTRYDSFEEVQQDGSVSASRYGWECLRTVYDVYFLNGGTVNE